MALKWRASGAALGQNSIGDWARSLHSSDRCAYSIMHAGLSPDADRRLNCLRSYTPDRPGVKTFHCLTRPKASSQRLEFFWKKAALALYWWLRTPKKSDKRQRGKTSNFARSFWRKCSQRVPPAFQCRSAKM